MEFALLGGPMTNLWHLERGASVIPGAGVRFSVWAPRTNRVRVRLTSGEEQELARRENGVFEVSLSDVNAGADYGFVLDEGDTLLPDPVSRWQPQGVHGPSRVVDPGAYRWSDSDWRGLAMRQGKAPWPASPTARLRPPP